MQARQACQAINAIVNRHLSLYAEGAWTDSENTLAHPGKAFAYLPKKRAAVGATFFTDSRISIGAKAIYRGERYKDEANTPANRLAPGWSGTVQAYWESTDKRWSLEFLVSQIGAKAADESVAIAAIFRF